MSHDPFLRFLVHRDRKHFTALVEAERDAVFGAAWRVVGDAALAEDVTQEVFVKVLDSDWNPSEVRSGRGFLVAQALGIARTKLRGRRRRAVHEKEAAVLRAAAPVEQEAAHEIHEAVAALPGSLAHCVELKYFGGLASQEIASHLGLAKRTVNERLQSAREKLRERLSHGAFTLVTSGLEPPAPSPAASADLAHKLEKLAESLPAKAAIAGAGLGAGWYAAGLASVLLAAAGGVAWSLRGSETSDDSTPGVVAAANANQEVTPTALHVAVDQPDDEDAGAAEAELAAHGDNEARTVALVSSEDGSTSLSIAVVDESGELVREGTLELQPADIASWNALDDFGSNPLNARWIGLLDGVDLAKRNPLVLKDMPDALVGPEFEAIVHSEVFPPTLEQSFWLESGKLTEVTLRVVPARTATFTVLSWDGSPIDGAIVYSSQERYRRDADAHDVRKAIGAAVARTGPDGRCTLDDLGAGLHYIEILAEGYMPLRHMLGAPPRPHIDIMGNRVPPRGSHVSQSEPDEAVVILIPNEHPAEIEVTVHAPEGGHLSGARVICKHEGSEAPRVLETDARGRCRFTGLEVGSFTVELEPETLIRLVGSSASKGKNRALAEGVDVAADETAQVELGFLPGTATWIIDIVDADGSPVSGMDVSAIGPAFLETETDGAGRARFDGVPAGEWSLMIFEVWTPSDLTIHKGAMRQDRLVRGTSTIRGKVMSAANNEPVRAFVHVAGEVKDSVVSSRDGQFELEYVPPGPYVISASNRNGTAEKRIVVKDGADVNDIILHLPAAE